MVVVKVTALEIAKEIVMAVAPIIAVVHAKEVVEKAVNLQVALLHVIVGVGAHVEVIVKVAATLHVKEHQNVDSSHNIPLNNYKDVMSSEKD